MIFIPVLITIINIIMIFIPVTINNYVKFRQQFVRTHI